MDEVTRQLQGALIEQGRQIRELQDALMEHSFRIRSLYQLVADLLERAATLDPAGSVIDSDALRQAMRAADAETGGGRNDPAV